MILGGIVGLVLVIIAPSIIDIIASFGGWRISLSSCS